ncbi:hypothetical protein [Lysobacter sp. CA199]|uniref:hypothetical protein n=1 Tax=Lysobacter sp. CA199 TaxID=3455608 RepID=UPI003F8D564B
MLGMQLAVQFDAITRRQLGLFVGLALVAGSAIAAPAPEALSFPPHAGQYFVLKIEGKWPKKTIHMKRVGSSGTSFFVRQYDCVKWKTRYIASADTVEDLAKSKPEPQLYEIVPGATADHVGQLACKK